MGCLFSSCVFPTFFSAVPKKTIRPLGELLTKEEKEAAEKRAKEREDQQYQFSVY